MFKLEGFCDDKYVVSIMKALAGRVMDFKMVPVANAVAKNGKLVAKTGGDVLELLPAYIKQHKLAEITPQQFKTFLASVGRAGNSYSHYLNKAVRAKLLKRKPGTTNGNRIYQVLK